jgi:hypothetical protein
MPTKAERRALGIPEGVPILVITRPGGEQELAPADRVAVVVVPEPAGGTAPAHPAAAPAVPALPASG